MSQFKDWVKGHIFEMQKFVVEVGGCPAITFTNLGWVGIQKLGKIANIICERPLN